MEMSGEMQSKITDVLTRYPVSMAAVFGSFARAEASEESDVDLLVEFYRPVGVRFFGLKLEIEEAIGRPVDLFRYSDMNMSDRAREVFKEARTIYVNEGHEHA